MTLSLIPGALAVLSLCLLVWQWLAARRFPLHRRARPVAGASGVTLLKPLKGCDAATEDCLRSWLDQDYPGSVQTLFGVASAEDPVCGVVRKLVESHAGCDAQLVITGEPERPNAKVCQLARMLPSARHELVVISDADVRAPRDLLSNLAPLLDNASVGLGHCFYRVANPSTLAMQWEAVAVNADFWSQVLQSQSLRPVDFALGAVMAARRRQIEEIGGFAALADCLADDYELGNRVARRGYRNALCPVVVECWSEPMSWGAVWKHQVRWARTIRVCQPLPYFFSILSNGTLWPLFCLATAAAWPAVAFFGTAMLIRMWMAADLQRRLCPDGPKRAPLWMAPAKDILHVLVWVFAFLGNTVEWRGRTMRLAADGTLLPALAKD